MILLRNVEELLEHMFEPYGLITVYETSRSDTHASEPSSICIAALNALKTRGTMATLMDTCCDECSEANII
jgi:hypothetical protein